MTINTGLLGPVIFLVAWSMVMWVWMYATRIPAMRAARMHPDRNAPRGSQMAQLPPAVRWKADNYNHLMEQPTIFYALALPLALFGVDSSVCLFFTWLYVGLRILHSLVQALGNNILVRFGVFVLSNIPLFVMLYFAFVAFFNASGSGVA